MATNEAMIEKQAESAALLPAKVEEFKVELETVREQLATTQEALALSTQQTEEHKQALNAVEDQRDEFSGMLRHAELGKAQAERVAAEATAAAARYRLQFLKSADPTKGDTTPTQSYQVKLRVLAWLGNMSAAAELGLRPNTCPLCLAGPACRVDPRRPNPHGSLLPKEVLDYLRTIVDEALANGRDMIAALDMWANGGDPTQAPKAAVIEEPKPARAATPLQMVE
jgi:hypothetical protein